MDCFCGCGQAVPGPLVDVNLRLAEMALEILAWDRYRTQGRHDPPELLEVERLIDRGAGCHRRLLATVHGYREQISLAESGEWLRESRGRWSDRPEMTEKGGFLRGPKLRFTEDDLARLDRVHPERSFSATAAVPRIADEADLVDALERLGALRVQGLLSDEEFEAAKAKLLD